jgi:hypothetical protein
VNCKVEQWALSCVREHCCSNYCLCCFLDIVFRYVIKGNDLNKSIIHSFNNILITVAWNYLLLWCILNGMWTQGPVQKLNRLSGPKANYVNKIYFFLDTFCCFVVNIRLSVMTRLWGRWWLAGEEFSLQLCVHQLWGHPAESCSVGPGGSSPRVKMARV